MPFFRPLATALLSLLAAAAASAQSPVEIKISGQDTGRTFEGIGAVSAGASTRMLYDYAEPYRSEILDYLFKPNFGAGFQDLKVEIGGGENSTCGSEPSHAISREELSAPKARGYEFWLMREARNRDPKITLGALPWTYPGWIKGRFTQDATDWFVSFLDVARNGHKLELDWISAGQNEAGTDRDWIVKSLRPTLDAKGYKDVKLQAPDDANDHWKIFPELAQDVEYNAAVKAVGYHYVNGREPWKIDEEGVPATELAKTSGKPLWDSEEWSQSGEDWDNAGALYVARILNKMYIRDRVTKTELWCPVASIAAGLPWSGTGTMRADEPWTGHYEVWPAVWACAHTTQFVRPGWRYLDNGCGRLDASTWKGSYVTLRDRSTTDWSTIICTGDAAVVKLAVAADLTAPFLHVWSSDKDKQFVAQPDVKPSDDGSFTVALKANSIYTITTTSGQQKGIAKTAVPARKAFPLPYTEDFQAYKAGESPRYFADQKGTFEVADEPGAGKCLKQILPMEGILWRERGIPLPNTVIGDPHWSDYSISADVRVVSGKASIGGRLTDQIKLGYQLNVDGEGNWLLNYGKTTLASGKAEGFDPKVWHRLKLTMKGEHLTASVDGKPVGKATGAQAAQGLAYLASTYDPNVFGKVAIEPAE